MKLQRIALNLLSFACLALGVALIVLNWPLPVSVQWLNNVRMEMPLGVLLLSMSLLVAASIGFRVWCQFLALGHQHKRTSRELERKDVSHEEAAGRVKALENKVQTLEKALQEALKR